MFCANCGLKETQDTQYCRSCGSDLNSIRVAISTSESVVGSASARSEIGKMFLKKIEGLNSAKELKKITQEVLPDIEKFLESPAEKRLRRIRTGSLISMIGFGVAIGFTIAGIFADDELLKLAALGFVTFFIGIAFFINGYFFSGQERSNLKSTEPEQLPHSPGGNRNTNDLLMPASARSEFSSVTEHTTRTLKDKVPKRDNSSTD